MPSRPIVLLVEDHDDTREMYVEALTAAGLSTVEATNAETAMRKAATLQPAAILADVRLGNGLSGLEMCEQLKQHPATKNIPMIVLTGWTGDKGLQARAEAAGCAAVLLKPIDPHALLAEVLRVIEAR